MAGVTTARSNRIEDLDLAFGMKRYEHRTDDVIWVWRVSEGCHGRDLATVVGITIKELRKMRSVIDEQIEMIETDGGRKNQVLAEAEE